MSKLLRRIGNHLNGNLFFISKFRKNKIQNLSTFYMLKFIKFSQFSNTIKLQKYKNIPNIISFYYMTLLLTSSSSSYRNAFEVEKEISRIVIEAENLTKSGHFDEAKHILQKALELADKTHVYSNISSVYELLSSIAFNEGGITKAEDLLVEFIEKLVQLGYPENHNTIVRFKLKLSRLYQIIGNNQMAELGYRDCINTQEQKLHNKNEVFDELTNLIYINSLFWYGNLLFNNKEYSKSKTYFKKALNRIEKSTVISPAQTMIVLYYNADVCINLKEYDQALEYLYDAIDICSSQDKNNTDLPLYLVKIGTVYMFKGLYDSAKIWCSNANDLATKLQNSHATEEANNCLMELEKFKSFHSTINNILKRCINTIFKSD